MREACAVPLSGLSLGPDVCNEKPSKNIVMTVQLDRQEIVCVMTFEKKS